MISTSTNTQQVLKLYKNTTVYVGKFEIPARTRIYMGGVKGSAKNAVQIFIEAKNVDRVKQLGRATKLAP